MLKQTIIAAAIALTAASAAAENETMYLIKGDRVVGKYGVDAVDYITFNLPDDVRDQNLWLDVDKVGKNTATYSVNTVASDITYAHNLLSYYDVNYTAMDMYGDMLDNLDEESVLACIKYTLSTNAFVGIGSQTFTQTDFTQYDPSSEIYRFSVIPGTKYISAHGRSTRRLRSPSLISLTRSLPPRRLSRLTSASMLPSLRLSRKVWCLTSPAATIFYMYAQPGE